MSIWMVHRKHNPKFENNGIQLNHTFDCEGPFTLSTNVKACDCVWVKFLTFCVRSDIGAENGWSDSLFALSCHGLYCFQKRKCKSWYKAWKGPLNVKRLLTFLPDILVAHSWLGPRWVEEVSLLEVTTTGTRHSELHPRGTGCLPALPLTNHSELQ